MCWNISRWVNRLKSLSQLGLIDRWPFETPLSGLERPPIQVVPVSKGGSFDKVAFAGSLQPFRWMAGAQLAIKLRHFSPQEHRKNLFSSRRPQKTFFSPRNRKQLKQPAGSTCAQVDQTRATKSLEQIAPTSLWGEGAPAYERRPSPPVVAAPSQAVLESCSIQPKRIQKIFNQDSVGLWEGLQNTSHGIRPF